MQTDTPPKPAQTDPTLDAEITKLLNKILDFASRREVITIEFVARNEANSGALVLPRDKQQHLSRLQKVVERIETRLNIEKVADECMCKIKNIKLSSLSSKDQETVNKLKESVSELGRTKNQYTPDTETQVNKLLDTVKTLTAEVNQLLVKPEVQQLLAEASSQEGKKQDVKI